MPTVVVILRASDSSNYSTDDDLDDTTTDGPYVNNRLAIIRCAMQEYAVLYEDYINALSVLCKRPEDSEPIS